MGNLKSSKAIWIKGILFALLSVLASGLLIARHPEVQTVLLLGIVIWSACRAYYFAFYVVENYVDPEFRFSRLTDFMLYALFGKIPDRR